MALQLPRLPRAIKIVGGDGTPSLEFQNWWQSVVRAVEAQENAQDAVIAALATQLALITAAQASADAAATAAASAADAADEANVRALGIQSAASLTFDAIDPSYKTIFDSAAPPP